MQPTATTEPARENLAGLVERVTFHNEDNGFCVLRVKTRGQRDLITVVGHAAAICAGEFVQTSGRWVNDRTHEPFAELIAAKVEMATCQLTIPNNIAIFWTSLFYTVTGG